MEPVIEIIRLSKQWMGRRWIFLVSAFLISVMVVGGEFWFLEKSRLRSVNAPRYLITKREIQESEPVTILDLTYDFERPPGEGFFLTDQDLGIFKGASAKRRLSSGVGVRIEDLWLPGASTGVSGLVPRGFNAYEMAHEGGLPLRAGEKVDVLYVSEKKPSMPVLLVEGALVLGHRHQASGQGSETTMALTQEEIALMEKSRQMGKLIVSVKSRGDNARRRARYSPRLEKPRRQSQPIPIFSEAD